MPTSDERRTQADAQLEQRQPANVERLYLNACAHCHEGQVMRAPHRSMIQIMSPESILRAMTSGAMQQEASALSDSELRAVAVYLADRDFGQSATAALPTCDDERLHAFDVHRPSFASGWGFDPGNSRHIPRDVAGLGRGDLADLELLWALALPDALRVRSAPAAAAGRLWMGSHDGTVFSLDQATGCVHWRFVAGTEVRTGIVIEPWEAGDPDADPRLYFGDFLGNVYAVSARRGELLWRLRADPHPNATITGTPSLHEGTLYVPVSSLEVGVAGEPDYACCTFRGSVMAIDVDQGEVLWQTHTLPEPASQVGTTAVGTPILAPSGAPVWNSPAIDAARGQLYFGTGQNYSSPASGESDAIFALDLETGDVRWVYQATAGDAWNIACELEDDSNCPEERGPDLDFGAAIILAQTRDGRDLVIGGQKSGAVHALDPASGELIWKRQVGRGGIQGGVHLGMARVGDVLLVPINDMPYGRTVFEGEKRPGLYALDLGSGEPMWSAPAPQDVCQGREFCNPGTSQAITASDDFVVAGALDGVVRIHDLTTGAVLWQFDTTRPVMTVSGEETRGGSMSGAAGALLIDGRMFVSSGYGLHEHMPGNAFLAFGIRARQRDHETEASATIK
ncbi:MAG: PQQ-binding-like beta-propeller repeat protein [Gammaproteobacteria bacterium]|nr:PQQ-binding-like beta-propeller repeat protein [Gammaproteobacteria bacterium]